MSDYALVHSVIPYMDILTDLLDSSKDNAALKPIIRCAAARGLQMLNKYYSKTDSSEIYRIAMSKSTLHGNNDERPLTFAA